MSQVKVARPSTPLGSKNQTRSRTFCDPREGIKLATYRKVSEKHSNLVMKMTKRGSQSLLSFLKEIGDKL